MVSNHVFCSCIPGQKMLWLIRYCLTYTLMISLEAAIKIYGDLCDHVAHLVHFLSQKMHWTLPEASYKATVFFDGTFVDMVLAIWRLFNEIIGPPCAIQVYVNQTYKLIIFFGRFWFANYSNCSVTGKVWLHANDKFGGSN